MPGPGGGHGGPPPAGRLQRLARRCQVSTTVSGFSEIETMPSCGQPVGEVGVVARPLAADADVLAGGAAGGDGARDQRLDRRVALVEVVGQQLQARSRGPGPA